MPATTDWGGTLADHVLLWTTLSSPISSRSLKRVELGLISSGVADLAPIAAVEFLYGNIIFLIWDIADDRNVPGDNQINRTLHCESLFALYFYNMETLLQLYGNTP